MGKKRRFAEIRDAIVQSLRTRPMNTFELTFESKTSLATLNRHLEYLKDIGIVGKQVFRLRDKDKPLWTLINRS